MWRHPCRRSSDACFEDWGKVTVATGHHRIALVAILTLLPCLGGAQSATARVVTLYGRVVRADTQAPIAGAGVFVGCCIDSPMPRETAQAVTQSDGSFIVGPVRLGKSTLLVRAIGFRAYRDPCRWIVFPRSCPMLHWSPLR
jgi:hypothetical protein